MRSSLRLIGVGFACLLTAWMMASQPFDSPDESAHYLRAYMLAHGELLGPKPPPRPLPSGDGVAAEQARWIAHDERTIRVPAGLIPGNILCLNGTRAPPTGSCVVVTYKGDYFPLPYLLPAAALLPANDVVTASWLTRGAAALPVLALLLLAVAFSADGGRWLLLGLLVATTPTALFIGSTLNPMGLEIASSLAFMAGLLRLARQRAHYPKWAWAGLGASGMLLILAWQLGPEFAIFDALVFALLVGRSGLRELVSARRSQLLAIAWALTCSIVVFVGWGLVSGSLHSVLGFTPIITSIHAGITQMRTALHAAVGEFSQDTVLSPLSAYVMWLATVLVMTVGALWFGPTRERRLLAATAAAGIALPILFYAWSQRLAGFGLEGRFLVPLLAPVPMLSGHILDRAATQGAAIRWPWIAWTGYAAIAVVQLLNWWANARHAAGQDGAVWFLPNATWTPPLGWWPWMALAALGAAAILGAGVTVRQVRARQEVGPGRIEARA